MRKEEPQQSPQSAATQAPAQAPMQAITQSTTQAPAQAVTQAVTPAAAQAAVENQQPNKDKSKQKRPAHKTHRDIAKKDNRSAIIDLLKKANSKPTTQPTPAPEQADVADSNVDAAIIAEDTAALEETFADDFSKMLEDTDFGESADNASGDEDE